jgi:peptidoglycan/xylan/chitin deacetylase (PgdA/CDA1 family)
MISIGSLSTSLLPESKTLTELKRSVLRILKGAGVFEVVADSRWRRNRLLILCYHGTSLEDEHLWRPGLYMEPALLDRRLASLKQGRYSVVPLGEGLKRLRDGTLPARSVAITFDDGTYDFYQQAYPLLKKYSFPSTVYQTTYYMEYERPVFSLICSYILWKKRGMVIPDGRELGLDAPLDLRTEAGRHKVVRGLIDRADREQMTGRDKDALAAQLAQFLQIDYEALVSKRVLQMMNRREVEEIANNGVDVQLHTHRHRTPDDETLFRREVQDNRERLTKITKGVPVHFCYPSGVYKTQFLDWLAKENVVSATTCDGGLATRNSENLLIPRYIDNQYRTPIDFESWLSGIGELLAFRRAASQKYIVRETD